MFAVIPITDLPLDALKPLLAEGEEEGFRFLRRLKDEWLSGANRFDRAGESLFGIFEDKKLVALGGLNSESDRRGRLRRFYVRRKDRRKGIGRLLAQHIVRFGADHYDRIVLHTDTNVADKFYRSLGFERITGGADPTHLLCIEIKGDNLGRVARHPAPAFNARLNPSLI